MADEDGFVGVGPDAGTGQCVALVKAAVPALGPTRNPTDLEPRWCKGEDVDSSNVSKLLPGTVIGYGFNSDGDYASASHGNHVAILVSVDNGKVSILDQWKSRTRRTQQEAKIHDIDINDKDWGIVTLKPDSD